MYTSQPSSLRNSDQNPPGVERRHAPRAATELSVLVGDGAVVSWARCVEISTGGVLLSRDSSTDNDWRIYLRLELELPGQQEPITAVARPVWSRGPFQALKFVRMSATDRLAVAEHVDRCSRSADSP